MKLTKNIIAATFAAVLIGGFGISQASAAVNHQIGQIDINEFVKHLDLNTGALKQTDRAAPLQAEPVAVERDVSR